MSQRQKRQKSWNRYVDAMLVLAALAWIGSIGHASVVIVSWDGADHRGAHFFLGLASLYLIVGAIFAIVGHIMSLRRIP